MADERSYSAAPTFHGQQSLLGLSHVKRSPKYSFKGRSNTAPQGDLPGPGAYQAQQADNSSRYSQAPRYGFGVSSRLPLGKEKVPGPGAYDHEPVIGAKGQSWSLTPRRRDKAPAARDLPGPGAHNLGTFVGQGPKYTASPRKSESRKAPLPGPGDYHHTDQPTSERHPRWGFGTSQRPNVKTSAHLATPGPGAYLANPQLGTGPKYSMKARLNSQRPDASPGPGAHGGQWSSFHA